MRRSFARAVFGLLIVLIASVLSAGALALSGTDPLLYADLDHADFEFEYVPQANSEYAVYLFSGDGEAVQARVKIMENGETIAEGEGTGEICSTWLAKDVSYTVRVHGSGNAVIEVARNALSRCFLQPLQAEENVVSEKMIAHEYDAHWYAFEAQADGPMLFTCVPELPDLALEALVFDDTLSLAGEFEALSGGAGKLKFTTQAGRIYYLRVSAPEGGEGYYALSLHRPQQGADANLAFDAAEHVIAAGSEINLSSELGEGVLLWVSDDPMVAAAGQDGTVRGVRAGETILTAYGLNSQASCRLRVEHVPLEALSILGGELHFSVGDDADIQVEFTPENASDRMLRFRVEDPRIANVSRGGVLKALQPGETTLIVTAENGVSDQIRVVVSPAVRKYRALLVGEQSYPFAENTERKGSENSVSAIAALLGTVRFENAAYAVQTRKDLSRSELIAQIRDSFKSATEQDVSLFYITCHGSFSGGMSFLELSDGSSLSVRDLERELRRISGTVVVMIDCCGSGGAIGAASDRIAFAKGVTGAFAGAGIRGSKYRVIASAGLDEDSYRIAFNEDAASGVMATVFARALCDGAGWNIDKNVRGTMGADRNYDGSITLGELQVYMAGRVNWYLDIASDLTGEDYRQSIQVYPEGDPLVLFERKS